MACSGTQYTVPQMWAMAQKAGYSGDGALEIVAHALVESGGCSSARNPSGATGILQFLPSTAMRVGLADPTDAQSSFDASFKLSGGTNFSDWAPYEPQDRYRSALNTVKAQVQGQVFSPLTPAASSTGTGLMTGLKVDPFGIGQAITDTVGYTGGTLRAGGTQLSNLLTVMAGLVVIGGGLAVLTYVLATRTDVGRGVVRTGKAAGKAALTVAEVVPK